MADFIPTDLPSCEGVNSMCSSSAGRNKYTNYREPGLEMKRISGSTEGDPLSG